MGTVIKLAEFLRQPGISVSTNRRAFPLAAFNVQDRHILCAWADSRRRVCLEVTELGTYATLTRDGAWWASWGLVRQQCGILVWDCVSLADLGCFGDMAIALATIDAQVSNPNVVRVGDHEARATLS